MGDPLVVVKKTQINPNGNLSSVKNHRHFIRTVGYTSWFNRNNYYHLLPTGFVNLMSSWVALAPLVPSAAGA